MQDKTYRNSFISQTVVDEYVSRYSNVTLSSYLFEIEKTVLEEIVFNKIKFKNKNLCDVMYLDYACGTGRILTLVRNLLKASGLKVNAFGMDISEKMLEKIIDNDVRLIRVDASNEAVDYYGFDIITCFRFFLNAEEELRKSILNKIYGMLKDDGYFIVNNHGSRSSFLGLLRIFKRSTHCMDDVKFLSALRESGFEVKVVYGFGILPGFIVNRKGLRGLLLNFERYLIANDRLKFLQYFGIQKLYVCQKNHL